MAQQQSVSLVERYQGFMASPAVRLLLARGGRVFVATEGRAAAEIEQLVAAGHRHFAEKYAQEISAKWPPLLATRADLTLHFYGHLQRNKVKTVLRTCHGVESLDRPALARELAARWPGLARPPALLVQVKFGDEPSKHGVPHDEVPVFVRHCRDDLGLPIRGLMCIPPRLADPLPAFRCLRQMADALGLPACSMGMSADHALAIAEGATSIRVARLLFAPATVPPPPPESAP